MAQEQAANSLSKLCVGSVVTNPEMINDFLKKACEKSDLQHNLVIGKVNLDDKVAYKESKVVEAVFLGSAEHNFQYFGKKDEVITCVAMLDRWTDGNGGEATLTHGGVGHCHVVFNVVSKFSWDSDFIMIVWAKPE